MTKDETGSAMQEHALLQKMEQALAVCAEKYEEARRAAIREFLEILQNAKNT